MSLHWPKGMLLWKEAFKRYQYVLLVIAVGGLLLLLPEGKGEDSSRTEGSESRPQVFQLEEFEEKLAHTLSQVEGAGETQVMLTLDGGSRTILAQDVERDLKGGGSTTHAVTIGRGGGGQEVVPLQVVAPSFRGALVVCPGGGDPQVRLQLIQAVSAVTGLGSDRISVCAKETE